MKLWNKNKKDERIFKELVNNTDWEEMVKTKKLSEEFLNRFIDKFSPNNISMHQELSELFIRKHHSKLNMVLIAEHQTLTEDFIREFADDTSFLKVALNHQSHLSVYFVREFKEIYGELLSDQYLYNHSFAKTEYYEEWKEHIMWSQLGAKHNLTPEFIDKYIEKFQFSGADLTKLNVDKEHYNEIRVGAKPLTNLKMYTRISYGDGIIFNPSSTSWFEDKMEEYAYCKREEVITGKCDSQCDHCKYKEEYENSDWQLDN